MARSPIAFIAGATGYVGRALARELLDQGVRVAAHVRPDSPRLEVQGAALRGMGAEVVVTPWEPEPLSVALERLAPTHVFCLIGTTRRSARVEGLEGSIYERVDLAVTRMLVQACIVLEHRPRFVYVSSIGSGPKARGAYLRARWSAEEAVRGSGLPYTIARPPIVTGPDRDESRTLERCGAAFMRLASRAVGGLGAHRSADRWRPMDSAELAHGLVHAALNYTTIDRVLEAEELRYRTANDREYYLPKSRRDADRH